MPKHEADEKSDYMLDDDVGLHAWQMKIPDEGASCAIHGVSGARSGEDANYMSDEKFRAQAMAVWTSQNSY